MSNKEYLPKDKEISELATVLGETFIQRWDMYSKQLSGPYVAVYRPLYPSHLKAHLKGEMTLGAYVLDPDSQGRFMVLDADDEPDWRRLKALAWVLSELSCPSYLEHSRRGGHLWLFFAEPVAGGDIRQFGKGVLARFNIEGIELFPKQARLTSGPGSLIRLPFGVHRKSGRRYGFYTAQGEPLAATLREQIEVLKQPETVPETVFSRFSEYGAEVAPKRRARPLTVRQKGIADVGEDAPLSEQVKAAISVRQFVLRYVELSPAGRGLCPFHDDRVESFSVNEAANYWHCFAGCGGGSIIDFQMKWAECDFKTAVKTLAEMVLQPADIEAAPDPEEEIQF